MSAAGDAMMVWHLLASAKAWPPQVPRRTWGPGQRVGGRPCFGANPAERNGACPILPNFAGM